MEEKQPSAKDRAIEVFAVHISGLMDRVIARPDILDLIGTYYAGDLVFQIHNGAVVIARRDISGPPDVVPSDWMNEGGE